MTMMQQRWLNRSSPPAPPMGRKSAPYIWMPGQNGIPQEPLTDYRSYVEEGFNANALIYSAIMYKVRALSSAPLRGYSGSAERPELLQPLDPLSMLLTRPNANQSWRTLQQLSTVYLNLSGNAYIYLDRPKSSSELPIALYTLRPDRVKIVPQKGGIKGYLYVPESQSIYDGIPILPINMIHVKFPNPDDPLEGLGYGLPPIAPLARNADVDNMVTKFLHQFFKRGAMGMSALEFNVPLTDATISRLRNEWTEIYGGFNEWGKPIVLDNSGKYRNMTPTFDQLGFDSIDSRDESRILSCFGVPGMLIGTRSGLERSTFQNFEQADRTFWQNTMIPELRLFEVEYQHSFNTPDDTFVRFDISEVPALQRDIVPVVEAAYKLWSMGTPRDVAFSMVGLNSQPTPGGDKSYVPVNFLPVDEMGNFVPSISSGSANLANPATLTDGNAAKPVGSDAPPESAPGVTDAVAQTAQPAKKPPKALPAPHDHKADGHHKTDGRKDVLATAMLQRMDASWARHGQGLVIAAKSQFEQDKRIVLSAVNIANQKALQYKSSVDWGAVDTVLAVYFLQAGVQQWTSAFAPLLQLVVTAAISAEADANGKGTVNLPQTWFDETVAQFAAQVSSTTRSGVADVLRQAKDEGWSVDMTSNRLNQVFQQYGQGDVSENDWDWLEERQPLYRSEMIAQNELMRFYNGTAEALYLAWGVPYKEWYTTFDDRTCEWCWDLHGTVIEVSGVFARNGQVLDVGGKRMTVSYGDKKSPPLHGLCRCVVLPAGIGE